MRQSADNRSGTASAGPSWFPRFSWSEGLFSACNPKRQRGTQSLDSLTMDSSSGPRSGWCCEQVARLELALSEVEQLTPQQVSLMPEPLLRDMPPPQAADLLAYLASIK